MADKKKARGEIVSATVTLPVEWHVSEGLTSHYANQAMIQGGQNETHILFFEVQPPLLMGTQDEMQEQVKKIKAVRAECISRIIVANEFLPVLAKMVNEALGRRQGPEDASSTSSNRNNEDK